MRSAVAFRVDASIQIGTGHVMRCLTLADMLNSYGVECTFICRQHPGHLLDLIGQRGHRVIALAAVDAECEAFTETPHAFWLGTDWETDAEQTRQALGGQIMHWLVVDHYSLDGRWERALRSKTRKIMVIDDLADRPHDCDLLLDQNLGHTKNDYDGLLNSTAKTLIGPQYALLRQEFAQWRNYSLVRRQQPQLKNLFVSMGGVDQGNATGQVLEALKVCMLGHNVQITVVMGHHAPWFAQVKSLAESMPWPTQVLLGVSNMAQLMAESDLAIGAAGSTSWERCALGLPSILLLLAKNQEHGGMALEAQGAAFVIQDINSMSSLVNHINDLQSQLTALTKMSYSAAMVTDGAGATRVAQKVVGSYV